MMALTFLNAHEPIIMDRRTKVFFHVVLSNVHLRSNGIIAST